MINEITAKPKYRHEIKYIVNIADYIVLSSMLKNILEIDKNAVQNNEYRVRSLYFDTLDNKDYAEKSLSLSERQKIRMRIYDTFQDWVKIERKGKRGKLIKKDVGIITKEDALQVTAGQTDTLLKYNNPIIQSIYAEIAASNRKPAVIVEYIREAYVDKEYDIRINFDKKISAAHCDDLFAANLSSITVQKDGYYVLELKYTDFFPPHIQSVLSSFDLIETTYSKYVYSRFDIF